MSALSGIVFTDRRPITESTIAALSAYTQEHGPDRSGSYVGPDVLVMQHALHFDRLSRLEEQPYLTKGGLAVTWDGRLDSRDDLLIRLHREIEGPATDVALVAAAFERWGVDCLPMLVGDWSLAVWDSSRETLYLATDPMGHRPLHYVSEEGVFSWSTCLDTLATLFDRYTEPDDAYVVGALTTGPPSGLTPFRGLRELKASTVLTLERGKPLVLRRHSPFEPRLIRYRRQAEYDDHLRSLLTDAVRVRLRSDRPVWSELSGGYDSSSVVCIANTLIQREMVEARDLRCISYVFPESPESDERRYMRPVEQWCSLKTLEVTRASELTFDAFFGRRRPFVVTNRFRSAPQVAESGARVILSGALGDLVMAKAGSSAAALLEHLASGHLGRFAAESFRLAWVTRRPYYRVLRDLVEGCLPPRARARTRAQAFVSATARLSRLNTTDRGTLFGIAADAIKHLPPLEQPPSPDASRFPYSKQPMLDMLHFLSNRGQLVSPDTMPLIRYAHPYVHRPLLDFVLGVPHTTLWSATMVRAGMRRALEDVLPAHTLNRANKGYASPSLARLLRPVASDQINDVDTWELVKRGYLEPAALRRTLAALLDASRSTEMRPRTYFALEAWLRQMTATSTAHERESRLVSKTSNHIGHQAT